MRVEHCPLRGAVLACLLAGVLPVAAEPVPVTNAGFEDPYTGGSLPPEFAGDVPPTAFPVGPAPAGWRLYDPGGVVNGTLAFVGVLNPGTLAANGGTYFPAGAAEGDNVALLYAEGAGGIAPWGIEQTLPDAIAPNTVYTLTVEVGNIASGSATVQPWQSFGFYDLDGFPGYRIELVAGRQVLPDGTVVTPGTVVASDDDSLGGTIPEGQFATSTVLLTTGTEDGFLGQTLTIRLLNLGQVDDPEPRGIEVDFDDVRLEAAPVQAAVPVPVPLESQLLLGVLLAAFAVRVLARARPARG